MMQDFGLWIAAAGTIPLLSWAIWLDLTALCIPNWLVGGVLGVFLVAGLVALPLDLFAWRLGQGVLLLAIGFGLFSVGVLGGGDAKLVAALAPFVPWVDVGHVMALFAIIAIVTLMLFVLTRRVVRNRHTGWDALDQDVNFPMALAIAPTMILYLGARALYAL